jgi:hypothetical protein
MSGTPGTNPDGTDPLSPCSDFNPYCWAPPPIWPGIGWGGGGGGGSGGGGGTNMPPSSTSSGPLPPGSFPGGENLGLPSGMSIPGPFNFPGGGCEFGACGGGMEFGPEDHHVFPQQFRDWFQQHGIDIEEYTVALEQAVHRLKPGGIHTKAGGNWNAAWKQWIENHPNATPQQILNQGKKFFVDFGIVQATSFLTSSLLSILALQIPRFRSATHRSITDRRRRAL